MAIVRKQTAKNTTTGSSIVLTLPSNITGPSLLVIVYGSGFSIASISSITQTGATWVKAKDQTNTGDSTYQHRSEIWYAANVQSSASKTITINMAASGDSMAIVAEYTGMAITGVVDQTAGANQSNSGSGTLTVNPGTTGTTVYANELWIGGLGATGLTSK